MRARTMLVLGLSLAAACGASRLDPGTVAVGIVVPGFDDSLDLADAQVTLRWSDATQPKQVQISAVGEARRRSRFGP